MTCALNPAFGYRLMSIAAKPSPSVLISSPHFSLEQNFHSQSIESMPYKLTMRAAIVTDWEFLKLHFTLRIIFCDFYTQEVAEALDIIDKRK